MIDRKFNQFDDAGLVTQVQDASRPEEERSRAAGVLLERYRLRLYQFCRRYVRDHDLRIFGWYRLALAASIIALARG